jgi:hypothetical protein
MDKVGSMKCVDDEADRLRLRPSGQYSHLQASYVSLYLIWLPHPDVLDQAMLDEQNLQVSLATGSVQVAYMKQQRSSSETDLCYCTGNKLAVFASKLRLITRKVRGASPYQCILDLQMAVDREP